MTTLYVEENGSISEMIPTRHDTKATAAAHGLEGVRVLVVDDDDDTREMIAEFLRLKGAEVTDVGSATEALEVNARWRPHVLVSDIAMPCVDGYALLRALRATGEGRGGAVPALALTGYVSSGERQKALRAGYQTYMSKPVDIEELMVRVADLAGRLVERA